MFKIDSVSQITHMDTRTVGVGLAGYPILPTGNTIEDHPGNAKYQMEFMDLPIPESIKKVAHNYLYVFPRAHEIEYLLLFLA